MILVSEDWMYIPCRATTLKMKTTDKVMTTTGSTLRPGDSSVYSPEVSC